MPKMQAETRQAQGAPVACHKTRRAQFAESSKVSNKIARDRLQYHNAENALKRVAYKRRASHAYSATFACKVDGCLTGIFTRMLGCVFFQSFIPNTGRFCDPVKLPNKHGMSESDILFYSGLDCGVVNVFRIA